MVTDVTIGGCDCHVHVVGPTHRYPMTADRQYTPPEASVDALRVHLAALGLSRAVIVQPSFYGTDIRCLLDALAALGDAGRGIAVVPPDVDPATLRGLDAAGVRGLRINLESQAERDAGGRLSAIAGLAPVLADLGWHLQVYASAGSIAAAADAFLRLPVPVVLDHFAMLRPSDAAGAPAADAILRLLDTGRAWVKLSAAYRVSDRPDHGDLDGWVARLAGCRPDRLLWASDWPHTNREPGRGPLDVSRYRQVDDRAALGLLGRWLPDAALRRAVLVDNPAALYRFASAD